MSWPDVSKGKAGISLCIERVPSSGHITCVIYFELESKINKTLPKSCRFGYRKKELHLTPTEWQWNRRKYFLTRWRTDQQQAAIELKVNQNRRALSTGIKQCYFISKDKTVFEGHTLVLRVFMYAAPLNCSLWTRGRREPFFLTRIRELTAKSRRTLPAN